MPAARFPGSTGWTTDLVPAACLRARQAAHSSSSQRQGSRRHLRGRRGGCKAESRRRNRASLPMTARREPLPPCPSTWAAVCPEQLEYDSDRAWWHQTTWGKSNTCVAPQHKADGRQASIAKARARAHLHTAAHSPACALLLTVSKATAEHKRRTRHPSIDAVAYRHRHARASDRMDDATVMSKHV